MAISILSGETVTVYQKAERPQESTPMATYGEIWRHEIARHKRNGLDPQQAAAAVERDHPGLREKFVEEYNTQHNVHPRHRQGRG